MNRDLASMLEQADFFMPSNNNQGNTPVDIVEDTTQVVEIPNEFTTAPVMTMGDLNIGGDDNTFKQVNVQEVDNTQPANNQVNQTNPSVYKALYEEFAEKYGFEVPADLKVESSEDLIQLFQENIIEKKTKESIDARLSSIGPRGKMYMDLREYFDDETHVIGVLDDLEYFNSVTPEAISESTEVAEDLITRLLGLSGYTPDKIKEEIEDYKSLGKLNDKAVDAKSKLTQAANKYIDLQKANKEQALEKEKGEFTALLDSIDKQETAGEIKLNESIKKEMKNSISKVVYADPKTGQTYNSIAYKQLKNGKNVEKALAFFDAIGALNFDKSGNWTPDFSKLSQLTTKVVSKKLDEAIVENQRQSKVGGLSKDSILLNQVLASL